MTTLYMEIRVKCKDEKEADIVSDRISDFISSLPQERDRRDFVQIGG